MAPSKPAYLRGVDSSVAAILAAKKAALDAQSGAVGPKEACARVEARVGVMSDVSPAVADPLDWRAVDQKVGLIAPRSLHVLLSS